MFISKKIWRIIPLLLFGTWYTYKQYKSADGYDLIDGFVFLFIGLGGLIFFIRIAYKDFKEFKASRELICYLPTSIGILFIVTNIIMSCYQESRLDSPTLISGFYDGDYNGFSVDFKANGNYVMANGGPLGENYFYGTYTLKDSIITIDKSNIANCISTNKFIISTEAYFQKDSIDLLNSNANYITQIDKNGKEIDQNFRFRVTKDNRNRQ